MSDETVTQAPEPQVAPDPAPAIFQAPVMPSPAIRPLVPVAEEPHRSDRSELQQGLRNICWRCAAAIAMESGGALGCARHHKEQEIAHANAAKDPESVRAALLLPGRADHVDIYADRACPVLKAWDSIETGGEPDIAGTLDSTVEFLAGADAPPMAALI